VRERNVRVALVIVDLFLTVSAFAGAVGLVAGNIVPLSVLRGTGFSDFTIPALLLGIVVGGSALAAAAIALFGPHGLTALGSWRVDALASAAAGCIILGWMVFEVALIGLGSWLEPAYFAVGLVMMRLAGLLQRAETHPARASGRPHAHAA
jgi:hypothetical protein